jgi:hypothetical protein
MQLGSEEREPKISNPNELSAGFKLLSIPDTSKFELENMLDDGLACIRAYPHIKPPRESNEGFGVDEDSTWVSISSLIAGSDGVRNSLLKLNTDPVYCALFNTKLADLVSTPELKQLAKGGKLIQASRIGSIIYSSQKCNMEWFVLISGKLKVKIDENNPDILDETVHEMSEGSLFGGCGLLAENEERCPFEIELIQPSSYVELSGEPLKALLEENQHSGMLILSSLGS